jgi:hypothetical protein
MPLACVNGTATPADSAQHRGVDDAGASHEPQLTGPIKATILAVRTEVNLVMLSAGARDGVRRGYRFTVFRGEKWIGKVEVETVFDDMSSARLLKTWQPFKVGDSASTRVH